MFRERPPLNDSEGDALRTWFRARAASSRAGDAGDRTEESELGGGIGGTGRKGRGN